MHDLKNIRISKPASHPSPWLAWCIGLTLTAIMGATFGVMMTGGF